MNQKYYKLRVLFAIIIIIFFFACTYAGVGESYPSKVIDVNFNSADVAVKQFLGFGAEWDPAFWDDYNIKLGVTEEDWNKVVSRLHWMRPPVVRVMMHASWVYGGENGFGWENSKMRELYRLLDVCMKEGITVILTDWGLGEREGPSSWKRVKGINDVADPKYAEVIGKYMDYLINKKGYSVIKYFVLVNEPNREASDWSEWKQGILNISKVFEGKSLKRKVKIMGPDVNANMNWLRNSADQLSDVIEAYDIHRYVTSGNVRAGRVGKFIREQVDLVKRNDMRGGEKPFVITEAGIKDELESRGKNKAVQTYEYGLGIADYAVQAVGSGAGAVIAWMLDDSMHEGSDWGMWKNKKGNFALKPWFYTWSLLTRYVPSGSRVYRVTDVGNAARILASSIESQSGTNWTFVAVNYGNNDVTLRIKIPSDKYLTFDKYLYSRTSAAADINGFPVPISQVKSDTGGLIESALPAESVVVLTTLSF